MPHTADAVDAPLMLSVSGARGIIGRSMTPMVAAEFAAAFGTMLVAEHGPGAAVCIARDSRTSGPMLKMAAAAGLCGAGCRVVDLGLAATPTTAVMVDELRAAGGMIVTASHNPAQWNGLKCIGANGAAPTADVAARIIDAFREREIVWAGVDDLHAPAHDDRGADVHVRRVLAASDADAIRRRRFTVVLDSGNGAGGIAGRRLLEQLGCVVHHLHAEPTGRFVRPPEPVEESLGDLAAAVGTHGAAVGFAQDPDADRLAIVDERGRPIGEECTLALSARRVLELRGGEACTVVTNLSTSRMIDDVAVRSGATVVRTAVGEANVAAAMRSHGAPIGGEGNGGVIFPPVCMVRDSLSAMVLVLSLMASDDRPISALADELRRYAMVKQRIELGAVGGLPAVGAMIERVARHFDGARQDSADGLRVDLDDGWIHLRPSNTEPIVRVIAEAASAERARELVAEARAAAGV